MDFVSKVMLIALFVIVGLIAKTAYADTQTRCIEMMKVHYVWIAQDRAELAERQLEVAGKTCKPLLKNDIKRRNLAQAVQKDKELLNLYNRMVSFSSTDL